MARYAVEVKPSARKELERLPAKVIERIFRKMESLGSEHRPAGCKKLKGGQQEWRIRIEIWGCGQGIRVTPARGAALSRATSKVASGRPVRAASSRYVPS